MKIVAIFTYYVDLERLPELYFYGNHNDFEIIVLDLTQVFLDKPYPGISRKKLQSQSFTIKTFKSVADVETYIENLNCFFFLYLCDRFSELKAWVLFRKKHCITFDYSISDMGTKTSIDICLLVKRIIDKIISFFFYKTLKALNITCYISTSIGSSRCADSNAIVDIHPDLMIRDNNSVIETAPKKKIMFIFQNFLFADYDFLRCGERQPDLKQYFNSCLALFRKLKNYSIKFDLCFHPKTSITSIPSWAHEFSFSFGVPSGSLGPSSLVIGHFSNVLLAAREAGATVLILNAMDFRNSRWLQGQISAYSRTLNVEPVMIEETVAVVGRCKSWRNDSTVAHGDDGSAVFSNLTTRMRELIAFNRSKK
jgi:hypothetical protein